VFEFYQATVDFFDTGIYELLTEFTAYLIISFTISFIESQIWLLSFSWDIAREILTTFDISGKIQTAFDETPSEIRSLLYFFRIPEVLTNIFSGLIGRYVFRFLG
jgi:hypothetical protein